MIFITLSWVTVGVGHEFYDNSRWPNAQNTNMHPFHFHEVQEMRRSLNIQYIFTVYI